MGARKTVTTLDNFIKNANKEAEVVIYGKAASKSNDEGYIIVSSRDDTEITTHLTLKKNGQDKETIQRCIDEVRAVLEKNGFRTEQHKWVEPK
jgi:ribosome maturation factor RimP